jgi:hypothetical protein
MLGGGGISLVYLMKIMLYRAMRNFPNHRSIQRQSVVLLALIAKGEGNNIIRIAAEVLF